MVSKTSQAKKIVSASAGLADADNVGVSVFKGTGLKILTARLASARWQ